jgi:hypothetical protein
LLRIRIFYRLLTLTVEAVCCHPKAVIRNSPEA